MQYIPFCCVVIPLQIHTESLSLLRNVSCRFVQQDRIFCVWRLYLAYYTFYAGNAIRSVKCVWSVWAAPLERTYKPLEKLRLRLSIGGRFWSNYKYLIACVSEPNVHKLLRLHDSYFLQIPSVYIELQQDRQCTYKCNIEVLSHNRCWCGKAISVSNSECVSVALVMQHAKRMSRIILSYMACLALPYFPTLSYKRHDFRKSYWALNVFWSSPQILSETFLILRRIQRDIFINLHRFSYEVPVIIVRF
jgi:hypothetical protein